jgi:hypothetical protein
MKTQANIQTIVAIASVIASGAVSAHGDQLTTANLAKTQVVEVVYDDPAYNRGIHGYPNLVPSVPVERGNILYVDKAVGQAIYSYPRNAGSR